MAEGRALAWVVSWLLLCRYHCVEVDEKSVAESAHKDLTIRRCLRLGLQPKAIHEKVLQNQRRRTQMRRASRRFLSSLKHLSFVQDCSEVQHPESTEAAPITQTEDLAGMPRVLSRQNLQERSKHLLLHLPPHPVFTLFARILEVNRPSMKERDIINFVRSVAERSGWWYRIDPQGNILIRKPGTELNHAQCICLQAHLDMVIAADSKEDIVDGVNAYVDRGWLRAKGTTLGADNGIGLATALSLLLDQSIQGPLEALFTVNEEAGMSGARNLQPNWMKSKILINLDSEEPNRITAGCAGSFAKRLTWIPEREETTTHIISTATAATSEAKLFNHLGIRISNLTGGHSGLMIHRNISSAIKGFGQCLSAVLRDVPARIVSLRGGDAQNSIPTSVSAVIALESEQDIESLQDVFHSTLELLRIKETGQVDEPMERTWTLDFDRKPQALDQRPLTLTATRKLVRALLQAPHGCYELSPEGHVESSVSLSTAMLGADKNSELELFFKARIHGDEQALELDELISNFGHSQGMNVTLMEKFNRPWTAPSDSVAAQYLRSTHNQLFGREPDFQRVHGGLELGLIAQKYPSLDCVSIGPEIEGAHTTLERLRVESVPPFYEWLKTTIRSMHEDTQRDKIMADWRGKTLSQTLDKIVEHTREKILSRSRTRSESRASADRTVSIPVC